MYAHLPCCALYGAIFPPTPGVRAKIKSVSQSVQLSNVDKEQSYKAKLGSAARKLKKQEKIAEAATEAKNTADELAANLAKELKVKQFIVDSITELEAKVVAVVKSLPICNTKLHQRWSSLQEV